MQSYPLSVPSQVLLNLAIFSQTLECKVNKPVRAIRVAAAPHQCVVTYLERCLSESFIKRPLKVCSKCFTAPLTVTVIFVGSCGLTRQPHVVFMRLMHSFEMTTYWLTARFHKDKHLKCCKSKQANVFICLYVEFIPSTEMSRPGPFVSNANGRPAGLNAQINDDWVSQSVRQVRVFPFGANRNELRGGGNDTSPL